MKSPPPSGRPSLETWILVAAPSCGSSVIAVSALRFSIVLRDVLVLSDVAGGRSECLVATETRSTGTVVAELGTVLLACLLITSGKSSSESEGMGSLGLFREGGGGMLLDSGVLSSMSNADAGLLRVAEDFVCFSFVSGPGICASASSTAI